MTVYSPQTELAQLADLYGLETSYEDVYKQRRWASSESLLAALRVLGADLRTPAHAPRAAELRRRELAERGIDPVIVAWEGQATPFPLTLTSREADAKVRITVQVEGDGSEQSLLLPVPAPVKEKDAGHLPAGFVQVQLRTPDHLDLGYHRLRVETSARTLHAWIVSAPGRAHAPAGKTWGCFLPLYALRTERNWGAGDFTDLERLGGWVRSLGGGLVGTLPLLAGFLDHPYDPSPYAPASRVFWNEFYIDVEQIPELAGCPTAQAILGSADFRQAVSDLRDLQQVDYRRLMALKRRVLELLAASFFALPSSRLSAFNAHVQQHGQLQDYAAFRATYERWRKPWQEWPARMRDGCLEAGDFDQSAAEYHAYVQWIAHEQIVRLSEQSGGDGLYLDLPLGTRADGFDVWRNQACYATGATAGAPPDAFFTKGQDWGFPPLHPEAIRDDGYQHVRAYLGHHMRLARTLRIDHVMGLHRLYWIPPNLPASEGVYVRYRAEELYAVLCLESRRHKTSIIGENLGTVPRQVNESLTRHGVRKMFVVQYELQGDGDAPLADVPRDCIASLNTHDMPTFAAWWRGLDIPLRQQLDLIDTQEAEVARAGLDEMKRRLVAWLQKRQWLGKNDMDEVHTLGAILKYLSASEAEAVLVNLEDLWLETDPQNVPGTGPELPNWKRKASVSLENMQQDPGVLSLLESVDESRNPARRSRTH